MDKSFQSDGISCPVCNEHRSSVEDTRRRKGVNEVRRRRLCKKCGFRFSTVEVIVTKAPEYEI